MLLEAEPGAGKTTRVPPALLASRTGKIWVLEPRRVAARMAARHVAAELGEELGQTVGYQVRFNQAGTHRTRLWFVTEGVLTRRLLRDGLLEEIQVVILDEFHERHLETDLAFVLLRRLQHTRPQLRIVLMSATLGGERLAEKLPDAALIKAPGRVFPVQVRYTPAASAALEHLVTSACVDALQQTRGDILVFLPGAAEIRRSIETCRPIANRHEVSVLPLHGDLSLAEQEQAVSPGASRRIVCSTNIAESSLTIEGVETVVDSGLARVLNYSHWSGLSRLQVEKISKASCIQRAGRAGRVRPGTAIRLYPETDFVRRPDDWKPEILRADLADMLLQLSAAGIRTEHLPWLDAPPIETLDAARAVLLQLGAMDDDAGVTKLGREMAALPLHPRLARFMLVATDLGAREDTAALAARLSEARLRLDENTRGSFSSDIDAALASEPSFTTSRLQKQLLAALRPSRSAEAPHALEKALTCAFPEYVGRRRGEALQLAQGTMAKLDRSSRARSEFVTAFDIDDRSDRSHPLVRLAADIEPDWLLDLFPDRIVPVEELAWNREAERVEQVNILRYHQLVIDETRSIPTDTEAASDLLTAKALEAGIETFGNSEDLDRFLRQIEFAAQQATTEIPADLLPRAVRQLAQGLRSFAELRQAARDGALLGVLRSLLPMRTIEEVAPQFIVLPSGRRARIEYHRGQPPSVSSRLQDFFGMRETPSVARGKVPLVVHLLAPNHRPVQVTTDLVSFWENLYPQVRRELSRRYPKHAWPESPG